MNLLTVCVSLFVLVIVGFVEIQGNFDNRQIYSKFANTLYKELAKKDSTSNIFFSPLSIHLILALVYVGAGGKTAEEMSFGLKLSRNTKQVETIFENLLTGVAAHYSSDNVTLEIANKVYLAKDFKIKDCFNKVATKSFLSQVEVVDFNLKAEAVKIINSWVEEKTHNKIHNIVDEDFINSQTKSVLVNALYFRASWEKTFDKAFPATFHVNAKKTKNVDMMHTLNYHSGLVKNEDIGADILDLHYKGNTVSFVVILPFKNKGLAEVEEKLHSTDLNILFSSLDKKRQPVRVILPKFILEETIDLNEILKSLGMKEMFGSSANFSGISDSALAISQVVHKSFIEVSEDGTEAAAATAIGMMLLSAQTLIPPPPTFVADHPFVFLIRCKATGAVLFMGRYADPK